MRVTDGDLFRELVSWENLEHAALKAAKGKRSRPDAASFLLELEPRIRELQDELKRNEYTPGLYRTFRIREPKERQISVAPFRDRVVHQALVAVRWSGGRGCP